MKTIEKITEEISSLSKRIESNKRLGVKPSSLRGQIAELQNLKLHKVYLETNPSEQYLRKESLRIGQLLNTLDERFIQVCKERFRDQEIPNSILSQMKAEHNKQYDTHKLKLQLKSLEYLLED
jgi:hypothetical protein